MSTALPSEALAQLLRELPARVEVERIDRIWLFSPREIAGKESGLVVLSLLPPGGAADAQRQVVTIRYEAERVRGALRRTDLLTRQGAAPADRVPRVIEGVVARLRDQAEDPVAETVGGDPARWASLLERLGVAAVDRGSGE